MSLTSVVSSAFVNRFIIIRHLLIIHPLKSLPLKVKLHRKYRNLFKLHMFSILIYKYYNIWKRNTKSLVEYLLSYLLHSIPRSLAASLHNTLHHLSLSFSLSPSFSCPSRRPATQFEQVFAKVSIKSILHTALGYFQFCPRQSSI